MRTSHTSIGDSRGSRRSLFWRLVEEARPYWAHIAALLLVSLAATPLALAVPLPLKIAVDSVLGGQALPGFMQDWVPRGLEDSRFGLLALATGLVLAIALLSQVQKIASSLLRAYTGEKLVLDFRSRLFRHAQRLSVTLHDAKGTHDSLYRIQYDTSSIQYVAVDGVIPFITAGVTIVGMVWVTARIDWQLALVALAVSPILAGLTAAFRHRLRRQWRDVKRLESSALGVVQEVFSALRVVKAFGQEDREQERFRHRYGEGVVARLRVLVAQGGFDLLIGITTAAGTAAILFVGVRHVQTGILTLGELLLVMSYITQLYGPLREIGRKVTSLQNALASAERAFALLETPPDVPEKPNARPISRARGDICFHEVFFAYGSGKPILEDISFEIAAGTRVAVAGRTGAGKTTLMGLLTRFFDPSEGTITLDGVDLRDYRLDDLRDQFAIVHQETVLFSTTVAENIAYGKPGAELDEIVEAARAANAHEFIAALPDGYDTLVGERGMRLSGGERQRIALARAFLRDAPILILDEPTAAVDIRTEAAIMEAMRRLMRDRTTFMVAHRLGTLETCDLLLVIEDGRLVARTEEVSRTIQSAQRAGGLSVGVAGGPGG